MAAYQHGGDIYRNEIKHDFSINVNPLGIPWQAKEAFLNSAAELSHYPDSETEMLTNALAAHHSLARDWILCGNGCADLIFQLIAAKRPRRAVVLAPTFSEYEAALLFYGCEVCRYELERAAGYKPDLRQLIAYLAGLADEGPVDLLFLCNPNNPTGAAVKAAELGPLLTACRSLGIFVVLDECFCEFLDDYQEYSVLDELGRYPGVMILRAFTKTYALAGLRLGYAVCPDGDVLARMQAGRQPWSVSTPAQRAGAAALTAAGYLAETRALLKEERRFLVGELERLGFSVCPSKANYLLFENPWEELLPLGGWCRQQGVLIRSCANYHGLSGRDYRVCIGKREDNELLAALFGHYRKCCPG